MHLSIQLENLGKRYLREWIFRNLSLTINPGDKYVILGSNGSGKSTLMQVIANYQVATEGKITYADHGKEIHPDKIYERLSIASPYLELIEEFTIVESITHQAVFKPFRNNYSVKELIEIAELEHAKDKFIKFYSSGMKQRLKLTLAILAECPLLLLDEPVSNLDRSAISWYKKMMEKYASDKTVIVCSNKIEDEYEFCTKQVEVENYKLRNT
ncbi:MAG: ATP-binding cassette domain-containing protein [Bacteroidia bacterium]